MVETSTRAHATTALAEAAGAPGERAVLWIARGARAAERALLDAIDREVEAVRRDPSLLARPIRVIVSSRGLREHLARQIVRRKGAVAGVAIQTLQALAREICERAGERAGDGDALFPILARRALLQEPAWREVLAPFDDGAEAAIGTLTDLLDAGLGPEHVDLALEALAEEAPGDAAGRAALERAAAIVRAAARVDEQLAGLGRARRSGRLALARRHLERDPELLPARAIWIHGFADATGVATDLLERLVREHGATLILDQPADPAGDGREPDVAGVRFTARLRDRIAPLGTVREIDATPERVELHAFHAPGADAELRGVARRIRALLDAGAEPEEIAVVARTLDVAIVPLRRHFGRLGIPFSTKAAAPSGERERRLGALLELLREGRRATVDVALDALPLDARRRPDLRVALHTTGAALLGDAAEIDLAAWLGGAAGIVLPVPRGLASRSVDEEAVEEADEPGPAQSATSAATAAASGQASRGDAKRASSPAAASREIASPRHRRRWVAADALQRLLDALRAIVARFAAEPDAERPLRDVSAELLAVLDELARTGSGDAVGAECLERTREEIIAFAATLPAALPISRSELVRHVARPLLAAAGRMAGGAGAGVQVLDAMTARSRTFRHVFAIGLQRDAFPRIVREDPLLSDALRARLRALRQLDLVPKESGHDEERWLFAELLSSAPQVVLSWQRTSEDGRVRPRSPFVDVLLLRRSGVSIDEEPALFACEARAHGPHTAHEQVVLAGLHDGRARAEALLPLALAERMEPAGAESEAPPRTDARDLSRAAVLAAAQLAVVREIDPPDPARAGAGPWMGFVGPLGSHDDLRASRPWVTTLESVARCGWKAFLERRLGLEPAPDALRALPGIDALALGSAVHRALERIARVAGAARSGDFTEVLRGEGQPAPSLTEAEIRQLAMEVAREVLAEHARVYPGLADVLAQRVAASIAFVLRSEIAGAGTRWLGAEVEGACPIGDGSEPLPFRADLITRRPAGVSVIDVKTGRPKSSSDLKRGIARGELLQAVAYRRAARVVDPAAEGHYLFVRPGDDEATALAPETAPDVDATFLAAVMAAREAWREGALAPRLVDEKGDEPRICENCEVAEACLRGDSGVRRRLVGSMHEALPKRSPSAIAAGHALLWLGRAGAS